MLVDRSETIFETIFVSRKCKYLLILPAGLVKDKVVNSRDILIEDGFGMKYNKFLHTRPEH